MSPFPCLSSSSPPPPPTVCTNCHFSSVCSPLHPTDRHNISTHISLHSSPIKNPIESTNPKRQFFPPMLLQTQSLTTHLSLPFPPSKPTPKIQSFNHVKPNPFRRTLFRTLRCSLSAVSEPTQVETKTHSHRPVPAEVSRTIMELVSVGTLSTLTQEGWPLGIGVRFAVDPEGTPVLCLNASNRQFSIDRRSSFHVQLEQSGLRIPQCTILGSIDKPEDRAMLKYLRSVWKKRFGEEVDEDLIYVVSVERVLQLEDFKEVGMWVTSSDYKNAQPDPLRDFAEELVNEINTNNIEDINRFCNIYADLNFQVSEAKLVWVDRSGFDLRLWSPQESIFEVRIPFPRDVTDEKGAKSMFNCMSQLAWEVEKNFHAPDVERVKQVKQIA